MNKVVIIFLSVLYASVAYCQEQKQQEGSVLRSQEFFSNILNDTVRYSVYLPKNYDFTSERFASLYFFHGMTDDENAWFDKGKLESYLNKFINDSIIHPVIAIVPDGKLSFFINNYDGTILWEDFFIKEFIPFIDSVYRTINSEKKRGVIGASMGGYGAIFYALNYSNVFNYCWAFSPAILSEDFIMSYSIKSWNNWYGPAFGKFDTKANRITQHFIKNAPLMNIHLVDKSKLKYLAFNIDCGQSDFLYSDNKKYHKLLIENNVDHNFIVREGGHGWDYWKSGLKKALRSFNKML